jgi:hypothetical protein
MMGWRLIVPTREPRQTDTILLEALKRPPGDREGYLREACAGNQNLLAQLANLLRAYEQAGSFLEAPAAGLAEAIASADFDEARLVRAAAEEVAALATQSEGSGPHDGPGSVIGPYKLLERIGEGGFGTVYLAEQKEPVRRRVAVKVIKLGMDTRQVIARFEAERQALAMMDHPHIAKVLDAGTIPSPTQVADSPWRGEGWGEGRPQKPACAHSQREASPQRRRGRRVSSLMFISALSAPRRWDL